MKEKWDLLGHRRSPGRRVHAAADPFLALRRHLQQSSRSHVNSKSNQQQASYKWNCENE